MSCTIFATGKMFNLTCKKCVNLSKFAALRKTSGSIALISCAVTFDLLRLPHPQHNVGSDCRHAPKQASTPHHVKSKSSSIEHICYSHVFKKCVQFLSTKNLVFKKKNVFTYMFHTVCLLYLLSLTQSKTVRGKLSSQ